MVDKVQSKFVTPGKILVGIFQQFFLDPKCAIGLNERYPQSHSSPLDYSAQDFTIWAAVGGIKAEVKQSSHAGNPPGQSVRRSVTSPVLTPSRWRAALPPGGSFTLCLLLLVLHGGFPCVSSAANRIVSPLGQSGNGSQDPLPGWPGEESGRQQRIIIVKQLDGLGAQCFAP